MSHDEIREALERIENKVDALSNEITGTLDTDGLKTRVVKIEQFMSAIKWAIVIVGGTVVTGFTTWVIGVWKGGK